MSYYIIEFFKYKIAQGLYIVRDGPEYEMTDLGAMKYFLGMQVK